MKEILFLEPVFKEMIWGGDRLKSEFNYPIPSDKTGECWAISAHKNGDCRIKNGTFQGQYLSEVYKMHREVFGSIEEDKFPLLVKIIDAKQDLSIQVHPDDAYAGEHEQDSSGKTECWYVLDCQEDSTIVIGHNAKTREELEEMIDTERWDELIRVQPVRKGDFFQINPGTVHAIRGGTLILEIQQSSDITYRVYDYGRLSDGKPRELHVEKSKAVIKVPYEETKDVSSGESLISCDYYTVKKLKVRGERIEKQKYSFLLATVIDGEGSIDGTVIQKGSNFILPFGYGSYKLAGNMEVIISHL